MQTDLCRTVRRLMCRELYLHEDAADIGASPTSRKDALEEWMEPTTEVSSSRGKTRFVSPLLNDAVRLAGLTGAIFLNDFESEVCSSESWSSTRRAGWDLRGASLIARCVDADIEAEAYLSDNVHVRQCSRGNVLRVPVAFPQTIDLSLIGRSLPQIIEHPLIARPEYVIADVAYAAAGASRLIYFVAPREPLVL